MTITVKNIVTNENGVRWIEVSGFDYGTGLRFHSDTFGITLEGKILDCDGCPLTEGDTLTVAVRNVITDNMCEQQLVVMKTFNDVLKRQVEYAQELGVFVDMNSYFTWVEIKSNTTSFFLQGDEAVDFIERVEKLEAEYEGEEYHELIVANPYIDAMFY
jgi:hypothetical protein